MNFNGSFLCVSEGFINCSMTFHGAPIDFRGFHRDSIQLEAYGDLMGVLWVISRRIKAFRKVSGAFREFQSASVQLRVAIPENQGVLRLVLCFRSASGGSTQFEGSLRGLQEIF